MANERRAPWLKFYSSDWRADPGLRMCSYAARGLWVDMLTLMHEADPYGHLLIGGMKPTAGDIAGLLGGSEREVKSLLAALETRGVFSRTEDGVIFSRRMLRDADRDEQKQNIGKKYGGMGGNPNIRRGEVPKQDRVRRFRPSDNPAKAARIFEKDNGRCHWCKKTLQRERDGHDFFHCDHVVPVCDGGTNDDSNLVAACAACNHERARIGWTGPNLDTRSDPNGSRRSDPNRINGSDPKAQRPEARGQIKDGERTPSGRTPERTQRSGPMPTLADPPARWFGISDKTEVDNDGIERPVVGGYYLDEIARLVCEAAWIRGDSRPVDWTPLLGWLRDGFDPHEQILPVVRRLAARPGYAAPTFLTYFDGAIREGKAA